MSLNFLATRFTCSWPWTTLVMLCDGRIVCGCADPYAARVVGDARLSSIGAIWTGNAIDTLRRDLNTGGSAFCGDCPLKLPVAAEQNVTKRSLQVSPTPARLYVECTAACNISCLEACCAPETGIARTRQAGMLDFDLFRRVVDETGNGLVRIDFFNYGESFLHRRAVEMCEYIKTHFPHVYLYTSTNGLAFNKEAARRLARSGIDEVTFSLDGATQDVYTRYRRRGNLRVALDNLRAMTAEKRQTGRDVPFINWRYILFTWNDNDEEMNLARAAAEEIGVDRLCWEVTDHPEHAFSRRFAPGSPDYETIRHEIWDNNNLGNAIAGATARARIEMVTSLPHKLSLARTGCTFRIQTLVRNLSTRPFPAQASYGRRLVRLGAQLCNSDGVLVDRDYARAWLPGTIEAGGLADVPIEIPMPAEAGEYQLKFDLVSEGIDWFEACGSQTTTIPFVVA